MNIRVAAAALMVGFLVIACGGGGAAPADSLLASANSELHSGVSCSGTVTGNVNTNLIVRSGATCVATGISVNGSVFVEAGALGFNGTGQQ